MNILALLYLLLIFISITLTAIAIYTYKKKFKDPLFKYTSYMSMSIAFWLFCIFLIQVLEDESLILFFHELKFISIISLPIFFYSTSYFLFKKATPSKLFYLLIDTSALLIFIGIMTNPIHHLFRKSFKIIGSNLIAVQTVNGPFFILSSTYGYILLIWAYVLLVLSYINEHRFYRKRELYLMVGALIPILTNLYFIFHGTNINFPLDYTPLAFFLTMLIYYIILFTFSPRKVLQRSRDLMINHMTSGSIFIDYNDIILDVNQLVLDLLELPLNALIGLKYQTINHALIQSISSALLADSTQTTLYQHPSHPLASYYLLKTSDVFDVNQHKIGTLILFTDVSELQHTLNQLKYVNIHDDLTGVYNRYYFQLQLRTIDTPKNYPIAIIVGDINGLKYINDTLGHASGDSLLVEVGEKLTHEFDSNSIVCRIGGDEFVVIIPNASRDKVQSSISHLEKQHFSYTEDNHHIGISLDYAIKLNKTTSLQQIFKEADANMYLKKVLAGSSSRDNNLQLLQKILSGKDIETSAHLNRSSKLANRFAIKLQLEHSQTIDLILLSQLHDIGKTVIPDSILFKSTALNSTEWSIMKTHSIKGYEIINASPTLSSLSHCVLHHHEHYDGTGYPQGLSGTDIPYLSRIITIIDAYDVMTHIRSYKKAMTSKDAIAELKHGSGSHFDPTLVKQFIELIEESSV